MYHAVIDVALLTSTNVVTAVLRSEFRVESERSPVASSCRWCDLPAAIKPALCLLRVQASIDLQPDTI